MSAIERFQIIVRQGGKSAQQAEQLVENLKATLAIAQQSLTDAHHQLIRDVSEQLYVDEVLKNRLHALTTEQIQGLSEFERSILHRALSQ